MDRLNRSSNNINIASFWENFKLNKYNFDPEYQRRGDVWNESKKSFLIDTIFKNFPMPPIFLHQHIDDSSGSTVYEVIDGKQRLQSIIDFIEGKISLPNTFSEDSLGNESLNGIKFSDLEAPELSEYKKLFWRYNITIEYIDSDDSSIINNVFDRLNRNGEPLNAQELRKAKYYQSCLYRMAEELSGLGYWKKHLANLKINRYDDVEFVSELLFVIIKDCINDASMRNKLDELYDVYCVGDENEKIQNKYAEIKNEFIEITGIIESFKLDLMHYNIDSVSHLYGLWGVAWIIWKKTDKPDVSKPLNQFYTDLRSGILDNEHIAKYKNSMQSNTKSKSNRIKRINSLLGYCDIETIS